MPIAVDTILLVLSIAVLLPVAVFCAECLLSVLLPRPTRTPLDDCYPRTVVLIPAHDEQAAIRETLTHLMRTLRPSDRVLVVADNCTDSTAAIARDCGAEVCERRDDERRGKPYALDFGLQVLRRNPPRVVVFLDADCRVEVETVRRLSDLAHRSGRPVQALNLSHAERGAGPLAVVSELSFRFKNLVRPLGCSRLGLPTHLTGTGMALPWDLLTAVSFAEDHLAEDMQLGIDLALRGKPALFCPQAQVSSALPTGRQAFLSQRTRWEQGHLRTSLANVPRLLLAAPFRRRPALLHLALDLTVPPLSLLAVLWVTGMLVTTVAAMCGASWWPALLLAGGGAAMLAAVFAGWAVFCRERVPLKSLAAVPGYVLRKVPIYTAFFFGRRQTEWVRTERMPTDSPAPAPADAGQPSAEEDSEFEKLTFSP